MTRVAIRWTVGDVSQRGFQALRLSVLGARRVFGSRAVYVVCVNSVPIDVVRARLGETSDLVEWKRSNGHIPAFLRNCLDSTLAQDVAWKFAPMRMFPDRFAPFCGPEPRNTGIRGLPPHFDLETALQDVLRRAPGIRLTGEVDEQGLQIAALSRIAKPFIVTKDEVTICSPFPPHVRRIGTCGAHFVGLNMRRPRPQEGCDDAMLGRIADNWDVLRPSVERAVDSGA